MIHRHSHHGFISCIVSYFLFSIISYCLFGTAACNAKNRIAYPSPPGYDLNKPIVYTLPEVLDEISGLVYYPKDSGIFAIQDEKGWLFKIHLGIPLQIERWKFTTGGDYEDISLVDSNFFVLKSKGIIEEFKFFSGDSISLQSFRVSGKNEFEALYYDQRLHQLVLVCKNCETDKRDEVGTWVFDPVTDSLSPGFTIKTDIIKQLLGLDGKVRIKPSAAAIDPVTGELFIIASVNKALIILNRDYSVKGVYKLNPKYFRQPEGMTFSSRGDLIISNESAEKGSAADILFFKYYNSKNPQ